MANRLIVGCGYVGMLVASKWLSQGDSVFAVTRSLARVNELTKKGIQPLVWNWLDEVLPSTDILLQTTFGAERPSNFATILISVSHASQTNVPHHESHTRGLNHLECLLKSIGCGDRGNQGTIPTQWIYISTTGVYGHASAGSWVDEDSEVCPERPSSIAAWEGEQWMATHVAEGNRVTLRCAGIYGPDRVPKWQSIRDQIPLQVDPESYLNLIHVNDLAAIISAVSSSRMQYGLYCVSDGQPVRRQDYYRFISELRNWPLPVFETRNPQETTSSRSEGSKRVRNHRIKSELAMPFEFPSYRIGLNSLFGK